MSPPFSAVLALLLLATTSAAAPAVTLTAPAFTSDSSVFLLSAWVSTRSQKSWKSTNGSPFARAAMIRSVTPSPTLRTADSRAGRSFSRFRSHDHNPARA